MQAEQKSSLLSWPLACGCSDRFLRSAGQPSTQAAADQSGDVTGMITLARTLESEGEEYGPMDGTNPNQASHALFTPGT
jgi:hypothetical protein